MAGVRRGLFETLAQTPANRPVYGARHLSENFSVRLKQYRDIAANYGKTACDLPVDIHSAVTVVWLN
jgi:transposase